jgi:hypothetical protein
MCCLSSGSTRARARSIDKFRKQLEGADDDVYQLSAELLYVQEFFTSLAGPEKKIENVDNKNGKR